MKKTAKIITFIIVLAIALQALCLTSFAAASASLTGPSTVRAGDTIKLTLSLNGSSIMGYSGTLEYDKSKLQLAEEPAELHSSWSFSFNSDNGIFTCYDSKGTGVSGSTQMFVVKFKVKSLDPGTTITVRSKDMVVTEGETERTGISAEYSVKVAQPLSSDATLKSLSIDGATLSPAFSPSTVNYKAEVPYATKNVTVNAVPNDSGAKASVSGTSLSVGSNDVTVTVTAANGNKKYYVIKVTRGMNDAADDSTLSWLEAEGYPNSLSPKFSRNVYSYVLWLPTETESVKIKAEVHDKENAKISSITGNNNLKPGEDNVINVVCMAGNGTTSTYTIIAKRAAGGEAPATQDITGTVTISGVNKVGERLKADIQGINEGATVDYTWYSNDVRVGSGPDYNVANDDVNATICVKVTGTGLYSGTIESAKIKIEEDKEPVKELTTISGTLLIDGTPKVGKKLVARTTGLTEGATVITQWYVDGENVVNGSSYNVCEEDVGKTITCKVFGTGDYTGEISAEGVKAENADQAVQPTPKDDEQAQPTASPEEGKTNPTDKPAENDKDDQNANGNSKGRCWLFIILALIIGFALGFVTCLLTVKRKKEDDEENGKKY